MITDAGDIDYVVEFLRKHTNGWHTYPFGRPILQFYLYFYTANELIGSVGVSWAMLDLFPLYRDLKDQEGKLLFDKLEVV